MYCELSGCALRRIVDLVLRCLKSVISYEDMDIDEETKLRCGDRVTGVLIGFMNPDTEKKNSPVGFVLQVRPSVHENTVVKSCHFFSFLRNSSFGSCSRNKSFATTYCLIKCTSHIPSLLALFSFSEMNFSIQPKSSKFTSLVSDSIRKTNIPDDVEEREFAVFQEFIDSLDAIGNQKNILKEQVQPASKTSHQPQVSIGPATVTVNSKKRKTQHYLEQALLFVMTNQQGYSGNYLLRSRSTPPALWTAVLSKTFWDEGEHHDWQYCPKEFCPLHVALFSSYVRGDYNSNCCFVPSDVQIIAIVHVNT